MSNSAPSELVEFHQFLGQQLAAGVGHSTPEEVLDEWRAAHPAADAYADDVAAVREALADLEAGDRGKPLAEFYRDFARRHGLAAG